jgi:hypothetical protein
MPERLELRFVKRADTRTGRWRGSVEGDVRGRLTSSLADVHGEPPCLQVTFDWQIELDDDGELVARLSGSLDAEDGTLKLSGTVTRGKLAGAKVEGEAHVLDGSLGDFVGRLRIAA